MCYYSGVGVVRLMGRQSGFIAMNAALANGEVDICLIPECEFDVESVVEHGKAVQVDIRLTLG